MDDDDQSYDEVAEKVFWISAIVSFLMFYISCFNIISSYIGGSVDMFWVFTMVYMFVFEMILWYFWGSGIDVVA